MTIRRGEAWGEARAVESDVVWYATDAEIAHAVESGATTIGVLEGGDLARTVGAGRTAVPAAGTECQHLPVDIGVVRAGADERVFVAHVLARRRLWGSVDAVLNAAFVGPGNAAPRAHPNDGRLDTLTAHLSVGDRLKARSRLPSGTHVPHPDITQRRRTEGRIDVDARTLVFVDGRRWKVDQALEWEIRPDATTIVI